MNVEAQIWNDGQNVRFAVDTALGYIAGGRIALVKSEILDLRRDVPAAERRLQPGEHELEQAESALHSHREGRSYCFA